MNLQSNHNWQQMTVAAQTTFIKQAQITFQNGAYLEQCIICGGYRQVMKTAQLGSLAQCQYLWSDGWSNYAFSCLPLL